MKKIGWFLLILIFISGCHNSKLIKNTFIEIAEFNGYVLYNTKKDYDKYDYIKDVYYAFNRENAYLIQFIELENEEYAKKFYEINKKNIEQKIDNSSNIQKGEGKSYSYYRVYSNEEYMLVIQNDNNVLYLDAPMGYLDEINTFLNELNLKY